jgi:O-antigen ligase
VFFLGEIMADLGRLLVDNIWIWTSLAGVILAAFVFLLSVDGSDWAPILVMATVPIQRTLLIGTDSHAATWTQAAVAGFFAGAAIRFGAGTLRIRLDGPAILMAAVVSLYGLSIAVADDRGLWAAETYRWAITGLFLIVARSYFDDRSDSRVAVALAAGAVVAFAWAALQVASEEGPASFVRSGVMRARGGFGEPNPYAAFIWAVTLPLLAFAVAGKGQSRWIRWTSAAVGSLGLAALVMTQSRGGMLGIGAGLCVIGGMLLRLNPRLRLIGLGSAATVAAAAIVLVAIASPWREIDAATTPGNWADQERTAHWVAAVHMVESHLVTGVGSGEFSANYRADTGYWRFRISRGHAHNAYLQVAAEVGLPGMLAYACLLAAILGSLIRRLRTTDGSWLALGVAAMTMAMIVHQLVDYLHVLSLGLLFAGLWAAALPSDSRDISSREHNIAA